VVPKAMPTPDADTFYSDSDDDSYDEERFGSDLSLGGGGARGGGRGGSGGDDGPHHRYGPAHHLHREARPAPAPTECHALGSLHNASYSLIKARALCSQKHTHTCILFLRCAFRMHPHHHPRARI
jgi:hypothetical protein